MKNLLISTLFVAFSCSLGAMEVKTRPERIRLLCGNNKEVVVRRNLIEPASSTVRQMLADINPAVTAIPLPNVDSAKLTFIIKCLKHPKNIDGLIKGLEDQANLKEIIKATKYLGMQDLSVKLLYRFPAIQWLLQQPRELSRSPMEIYTNKESIILPNPNQNKVNIVSVSKDKRFAAASYFNHTVQVWDMHTRRCIRTLQHSNIVNEVKFSDDNQFIATCCYDNNIRIWDIRAGTCVQTLHHPGTVNEVKFSNDNKFIIISCHDNNVSIWNIHAGTCLQTLHHPNIPDKIKLDADNKFIVTYYTNGRIFIWNMVSGELIQQLDCQDNILKVRFSKKNNFVVKIYCKKDKLLIWRIVEPEQLQRLQYNQVCLISKIYKQARTGNKLDLSDNTALSNALRTIFNALPENIQGVLQPFVNVPVIEKIRNFFTRK